MFSRIDHVGFPVTDPYLSAEFYKKYFGFQKIYEEEVPFPFFEKAVYIKLNDIILELYHFKSELPDFVTHFCLYTDDFDRDFARLKKEGIPIDEEPHPAAAKVPGEKNCKRAVIVGPDGELIEIRG